VGMVASVNLIKTGYDTFYQEPCRSYDLSADVPIDKIMELHLWHLQRRVLVLIMM
jgi:hypothetical protein